MRREKRWEEGKEIPEVGNRWEEGKEVEGGEGGGRRRKKCGWEEGKRWEE